MKIIVFYNNEYKAVLSDSHKPILTNYYDDIKTYMTLRHGRARLIQLQ